MTIHRMIFDIDDSDNPELIRMFSRAESLQNHDRYRSAKSIIGICNSTSDDEVKGLQIFKLKQ